MKSSLSFITVDLLARWVGSCDIGSSFAFTKRGAEKFRRSSKHERPISEKSFTVAIRLVRAAGSEYAEWNGLDLTFDYVKDVKGLCYPAASLQAKATVENRQLF